MKLCDYGCGRPAVYQFKNGKWCCSSNQMKCPVVRKKNSIQIKKIYKDPNSVYNSVSYRKNLSNGVKKAYQNPELIEKRRKESIGRKQSEETIKKKSKSLKKVWKDPNSGYNLPLYKGKQSDGIKEVWKNSNSKYNLKSYKISQKLTIEKINIKYSFFSKIEDIRYDPDKPDEKEVQVHCKNHECENSKEKNGWFTPTYIQLYERIRQLESKEGNGGSYFYCCQECKDTCSLYNIHSDPLKDNNPLPYTSSEIQTLNKFVLKRENGLCEYCGEPAEHVHHIFPKKLEPFFALDPDYCIACCEKHHYKYGHKDECSTGNLAKMVCSVESQKFLNQKI